MGSAEFEAAAETLANQVRHLAGLVDGSPEQILQLALSILAGDDEQADTDERGPTRACKVTLTAELVTTVAIQVSAGDDARQDAYNRAVKKVEALLQAAFKDQVDAWNLDVRHDEAEEEEG